MEDAVERERAFHNQVYREGTRSAAAAFYSIANASRALYRDTVLRGCTGLDVLEYGCGPGGLTFTLTKEGARVMGIDISEEAIRRARTNAEREGVKDAEFRLMDAHALELDDDSFDRICGSGILHHLDLERALPEIARVLRPEGTAIFFEPLGHNPLINWYRRITPQLRTPDEHPLLLSDLDQMGKSFREVQVRYFHLASLMVVPLRRLPGFSALVAGLDRIDRALFRTIPGLSRHAWVVVIQLSRPMAGRGSGLLGFDDSPSQ